ncbi:MAG: 50S ribosomal protein L5 [Parcubacteria group bacterium GW2011_GWC2_39_14]|nr:MAG: 50S ribosomal protein L5 [Parcubacteria group bacterium GW2011_GWC2_39_14]KKR55481.1 MAG: 50S ribosomal protein L5 [Parcubacteria group bacterium GW2011_GWA2_40_23]
MNNLLKQYRETIAPALMAKFSYKNKMAVPNLNKVVLNVGMGQSLKDKEFIEAVVKTLERITGQRPVKTIAKKAISNFKIREGQVIGAMVTLRGNMMWDFIEKLIKVTLPRVRDFRGISTTGFDKKGSYSLGLKEYICFPEIQQDEVERLHGLQVNVVTTAQTAAEGRELLTYLGFPFKTEENK